MRHLPLLLLAASGLVFSGCETLNSLSTMASDFGKNKFLMKDSRFVLSSPTGSYLGKPKMAGGSYSPTMAAELKDAQILVVDNDISLLSYGQNIAIMLPADSPLPAPHQASTRLTTNGRAPIYTAVSHPENDLWKVEPNHVKSEGKPVWFGDLVRLKNQTTGNYLRGNGTTVSVLTQPGDAIWSIELAPVPEAPAPAPAPTAAPAPATK